MAIPGQEQINVSNTENQASNSDSLFTAFHKIQNNFTTLFSAASPFNTFRAGNGITANADVANNTITFTNTGVTSLVAGTGVTLANANGAYTISASGGNGQAGVTNVNVISSSLAVSGVPIISSGTIRIDIPVVPTGPSFATGTYVAPTVTVDKYGRITEISNSVGTGTVTSVSVAGGPGITVYGGTVTDSGTITVTNTGVTSIKTGTGLISSSPDGNGDVTVAIDPSYTTGVTSIGIVSNTLTVTGGPITSTGSINIEIPDDFTITGHISLDGLTASQNVFVGNILTVSGPSHFANITSGNANLGNLAFANYIGGNGTLLSSLAGSNVTGQVANALISGTVYTNAQPNITSVGTLVNTTIGAANSITGGNLVSANYFTGTLTTKVQPNITSVGTLISANVTGNVSAGNVSAVDIIASNSFTVANTSGIIFNTQGNNSRFTALQPPDNILTGQGLYGSNGQPGGQDFMFWNLPNTWGKTQQFMTTDGSGTMKWSTIASSSAPSTSTSVGTQGTIAFDATHIYVCIAANSWIRASAASW